MRVETIGDASLYLGDCAEILPTLGVVDAVISDPPYSAHVHASGKMRSADGRKGEAILTRDLGFNSITPEQIALLSAYAATARRWSLVFSDTESSHLWREAMEEGGLQYVRTAFWKKTGGAPQFTGDRPAVACEAITICHPQGRKRWNGGGKHGFYDVPIVLDRGGPTSQERVHTTQKPLALMASLVSDFTDAGDAVADPFMGSGTTGVACVQAGRAFIGIERDQKYFDIACRRIEQARSQGQLFAPVAPKAEQLGLEA